MCCLLMHRRLKAEDLCLLLLETDIEHTIHGKIKNPEIVGLWLIVFVFLAMELMSKGPSDSGRTGF